MSFELELYAEVADWDEAKRAAAATAAPGHVAVVPGRRWRRGRNAEPSIHFDWRQGQDVLSDQADWSEDAFTFSEEGRHNLAETLVALAAVLRPGWGIRAYWGGDPIKSEETLSARELAERVRQSQLNRYTMYRVR